MTSPAPTQTAPAAAARTLEGVVTAVLVTRGTTAYLAASLAAVLASDPAPGRVLVVDVSPDSSAEITLPDPHLAGLVTLVRAPGARSFGAAVATALRTVTPAVTTEWLWLFHDDSAPAPDALSHLLRGLEHTASVAVAGAKQVRWENADELIEVGFTVSRSGRRMTGVEQGEIDQGQHDSRDDVLAVGLTGALVRLDVWTELGGTDSTYGVFGDGLDLCRRARLAGHRVIVVPSAVVRHAQVTLSGAERDETFGARLRSQLYFLATGVSGWLLPFFFVATVLAAPVRALYRITMKVPRHALDELWAPLWLLARAPRVLSARLAAARTSAARRGLLIPLMATTRDVLDSHQDRRLAHAARRKAASAPHELDLAEIRATAQRRRLTALGVAAVAVAATIVALRPLVATLTDGSRIIGGAMLPAGGGFSDLWQAVSGGWIRDGLGASAPADPLLTALLPATVLAGGDVQLAVNAIVVGALVLAGLGAWFAAGAATRSLTLRFWAALMWFAAPPLLLGVGQGRLGAILAHAALPWFALALARTLGVQRGDTWGVLRLRSAERADQRLRERAAQVADAVEPDANEPDANEPDAVEPIATEPGADAPSPTKSPAAPRTAPGTPSIAALGAAALAFAVVVAGAPVLLLPGILTLVVVAIGAPGHRRYLTLIPLPALAIAGPLLLRAGVTWSTGGWRILLGDPGLPLASSGATPWRQLLALPVDPSAWFTADGAWGLVGTYAPYAYGVVLVAAALFGLLRHGGRGRAACVGWGVAAIGLATALVSAATVVAAGTSAPVTGWAGAGLSLLVLGLGASAILGLDGLATKTLTHTFGWRQMVLAVAAVLVTAVPLAGLVAWSAQATGDDSPIALRALDRAIVPAVGQQMQSSGRQARVLVLEARPDGSVAYQLLHDDGPQLTDSSVVVNVAGLAGRTDDTAELVARVSTGTDAGQAQDLAELGIGAVLVPPSTDLSRAQLVSRIDTVPGVARITENESGTIWRVTPDDSLEPLDQPAWARIYAPGTDGGRQVEASVEAGNLSIDSDIAPGAADRVLVLAENAAPGWRAELDGAPLRAVSGDERQTFALGSDGGHLTVSYERASRMPWLVLQGVVVVVFFLLALPVRRRRGLR
ncbi:glycosyltransferase family 2 protein [Sanguibacter gelidistatuariae]|nr:glycosyltransferase [Sanguibacter gelidistatuariae]